ncbi:MAG: F0F1 ATP synthase subunit A [Lachnospiraceae bacterium]|nr:F0F1 ATP synthase subunit A [Lachnospiraceae bacterium]
MSKKTKVTSIVIFSVILLLLLVGIILLGKPGPRPESLSETMKDAVLHESMKVSLFGIKDVNPGLISAFTVTGIVGLFAIICRIFVIPRFTEIPGKFQMFLEMLVDVFRGLAKGNSPEKNGILSAYIFAAGIYIFVGTMFELFGIQAVSTSGASISLPAPLSDINGAIAMGCGSYLFILIGGISNNGFHGLLGTIKEFSLPLSMSFRLFGALLSGALVTELVYYASFLSFGLPVIVGVLFTVLHALIQAYVLTLLVSIFYGEVSEKKLEKPKKQKKKKNKKKDNDNNNLITPEVSQ